MPQKRQHVVVCKTRAQALCGAEEVLSPTLARKLSCCLQDHRLPHSKAKCLQHNALGPELSCCLQDGAGAVFDPGLVVAPGYAPPNQGFSRDIASNTQGVPRAICENCPDRLGDRLRPLPAFAGETHCAASSDIPTHYKRSAAADTSMVGRTSHSSGSAVRSYSALSHCTADY
jgi:hypothetical protein